VIQPLESVNPENWNFRLCPDGAGATDANSLVVARNLIWPGAMAIAGGKRYVNIYFGNGIIQDKTTYTPPMPAPIQVRIPEQCRYCVTIVMPSRAPCQAMKTINHRIMM
jgi:hypothetical protein